MITAEATSCSRNRRVACTPLAPGMRRSSKITSGFKVAGLLQRARRIVRLADHDDVARGREQLAQPFDHHRMIVDEQDRDHRAPASASTPAMATGVSTWGVWLLA